MSWMIHFNGEDIGPVADAVYSQLRQSMNDIARKGGCVGFRFPDIPNEKLDMAVDSVGNPVVVREFFWTPGAPISFTHVID